MSLTCTVPEDPKLLKVHLVMRGNTYDIGSVRFSGSRLATANTWAEGGGGRGEVVLQTGVS